ncbi:MAG: tetratricopeptide repeat protein [bacterium]
MKRFFFVRMATVLTLGLLLVPICWRFDPAPLYSQTRQQLSSQLRIAQNYERRGNYESALRIFKNLYDLVPGNQLYYEGVKRNLLRLNRFDELITIIKARLDKNDDVRSWADLGNVYYKKGLPEEGRKIWAQLLAEHSHKKAVYVYVAQAMLQNRLYEEAIEVYKLARTNLKQDDIFVFELADIYVLRLNYKLATLEYLKYLERYPRQFTTIETRIARYTKEPEDARAVASILREAISSTRQEFYVRKLLANLYLRYKDFDKSFEQYKILEKMKKPFAGRDKSPGRELFHYAELARIAKDYQHARQAYSLIINDHKSSPYKVRAEYGLALASQKSGLAEKALLSYDALIRSFPNSPWAQEALFQKGEIYLEQMNDIDRALAMFQDLLQKYPKSTKRGITQIRIGDCYAERGAFDRAQQWYEKTQAEDAVKPSLKEKALYLSAYVDFVRTKFDDCLEKLNRITANLNENTAERESYKNDALELIFLIEENRSSSPEALKAFARARGSKLQKRYAEAIKELQEILDNYPSAAILDDSLLELGDIEETRGNHTVAINYYQGLVNEFPQSVYNALAQKRTADIYQQGLGDLQKAREAYEAILIKYPNSLYIEEVRQKLRNLESRKLSN